MGEEKITREISQGVKYPLTQELREDIQQMRLALDFSTDTLSALINLKKETYNNLEKKSSKTKTITSEVLDKLFEVFYNHSANQQGISKEEFIIYHLEKFMSNPNTVAETLDQQYWLMALYLKYQTVSVPPSLFSERELRGRLQELSESNKHIKLKTDITIENEVYIALNEKKYAPLGNHPYKTNSSRIYTNKEIEQICNFKSDRQKEIQTMAFLGLRVSELINLKAGDFNLTTHTYTTTTKDGRLDTFSSVYVKGKGGKESYRVILPQYRDFFAELIKGKGPEEKIFNLPTDTKLARLVMSNEIRKITKELGIVQSGKNHQFRKYHCQIAFRSKG